jgi:15-cis-phytoene synthase
MKKIFDDLSHHISKVTTQTYSTSFSLGIKFLDKELRQPIYDIYGFVRFADEIVDSFHGFDKEKLMADFRRQTFEAIEQGVSLNPVLNSFQATVNRFNIPLELIDTFLRSMEMDLDFDKYSQEDYETYILGSAEVVGLMCLKIFVYGNEEEYKRLTPNAMKLGSAFQKINFLRDLKDDYHVLGRTYFPGIDLSRFNDEVKRAIEEDIERDFHEGYLGILELPKNSRFGVYMAYVYYYKLFMKIKACAANQILNERVRIPNNKKYRLFLSSYVRHSFNLV